MKKLELFYPVKPFIITQKFGVNGEWYQQNGINIVGHNGLDVYTVRGQYVRAAHDGIVTFVGSDSKGGWGVEIRTTEPREYKGQEVHFRTIYWHLIPNIPVKAGQQVKVGDIIGYADSTGFSTGDHLHFALKPIIVKDNEMWYNVEQDNGYWGAIDPTPYLVGMFAEDYASISNKIKEIADKINELFKKIKGQK